MSDDLLRQLETLDTAELRQLHARVEALLEGSRSLGRSREGRRRPCPARSFAVPEDIKFLDEPQLEALTAEFKAWAKAARTPAIRRSRMRVWLVYVLVRYAGLKLGEALSLDDRRDIDFDRSLVLIREESPREVMLSRRVVKALRLFLEDPVNYGLLGEVFRLDPGYVRKKFYERAQAAGIPKHLASPSVLRHSYAIELLRNGVPLPVVQTVLGHQSLALTANYVSFADEDAHRIINHYFERRSSMKTSARNSFTGKVTAIRKGMILSEVELTTASGLKVVSVVTNDSMVGLGVVDGLAMTATVKAPWVILVKEENKLRTSARNKYCGAITTINEGQIAAEVIVTLSDGTKVCSLVTDESVRQLGLKVGDNICALFKAFSVVLNAD